MNKLKMGKLLIVFGVLMLAVGGFLLYSDKDVYFKPDTEPKEAENSNNPTPAVPNNPEPVEQISLSDYSGLYYKDDISIKVFGHKNKIDFAIVGGPELMHQTYDVTGDTFTLNDRCTVKLGNQKFTIECVDSELSGEYEKADSYNLISYYTDNIGDPGFVNTKFFGEFENDSYKIVMYQKDETNVDMTILNLSDSSFSMNYNLQIVGENELHFEQEGLVLDVVLSDDNSITFTANTEDLTLTAMNSVYQKTKVMTMETIVDFKLA